jgi:hypothetical protein
MAKVKHILTGIRLAFLLAIAVIGLVACDATNVERLTVTPSHVDLWDSDNAVTISVVPDSASTSNGPYEWWVNDDSLGSVVPESGDQVLYFRTAKTGDNYVFVRDAYNREGWAVIRQY